MRKIITDLKKLHANKENPVNAHVLKILGYEYSSRTHEITQEEIAHFMKAVNSTVKMGYFKIKDSKLVPTEKYEKLRSVISLAKGYVYSRVAGKDNAGFFLGTYKEKEEKPYRAPHKGLLELEEMGFVKREESPGRRDTFTFLPTEKGKEILNIIDTLYK